MKRRPPLLKRARNLLAEYVGHVDVSRQCLVFPVGVNAADEIVEFSIFFTRKVTHKTLDIIEADLQYLAKAH